MRYQTCCFNLKYDPLAPDIRYPSSFSIADQSYLDLDMKPGTRQRKRYPSIRASMLEENGRRMNMVCNSPRGRKQKSWQGVSRPFPVISTHSCLLQRRHRVALTTSQHHMCEPLVPNVSITVQISGVSMLEWETRITKSHL